MMGLAEQYPMTFKAMQDVTPSIGSMHIAEGLPTVNKVRVKYGLEEIGPSAALHKTMEEIEEAIIRSMGATPAS